MVDPDAPTPQNPNNSQILHWLQPDVSFGRNGSTIGADAIVSYNRPRPPPYSDNHRYTLFLYPQPDNFSLPTSPVDFSSISSENRTKFDIEAFASAAGLDQPVAANYFLCNNKSSEVSGTATSTPSSTAASTATSAPISTGGADRTIFGTGMAVGGFALAFAMGM